MILQIIQGLFISYIILFFLSIILKDNSIADIFWGLGFLQVAIHSTVLSGSFLLSQILLLSLITVWSLRISLYILSKKIIKKGEDPRYAVWRKEWKYFYLRSFFQVYILQGLLLLFVSTPIILFNISPLTMLSPLFISGLIIALAGLIFETISDLQLRAFIKKVKGKIMKSGLWKYSRHPNYFGESVFWFGVSISAFTVSPFSFIGWAVITYLLRFVSGVPMAERAFLDNPEFLEYKKKTPPMFPNFFMK